MTKTVFRISGMHCSSCAMLIDLELADLPGVADAKTNYARATTEVTFDPGKVSLDTIVATIRAVGYTAAHG